MSTWGAFSVSFDIWTVLKVGKKLHMESPVQGRCISAMIVRGVTKFSVLGVTAVTVNLRFVKKNKCLLF